ncbi:hypothetical protein [Chromobacterium sp. ASV23]|uniref:hypothetical protein n=1 Tax=Chromobacterium sp. ASV23 TaxID=2795110 RepID=UPI0018EC3EA8|nr:hypothetical protein [Chromobacterium sp. ASV23]
MANLQEKPAWEAGIYQLETSDPVLGGPDGVDNLQAKQLANRTVFLKKQIDDLVSGALTAEYADRLKTPRNIAMTGDGSWNVTFDASGNVSAAMTLSNSGVTAGSYGQVTVDAKGRVTAARAIVPDDVPALDWSKISSGKPTTLAGYGIADGASKSDLQNAVNGLVNNAPANLNTLQELAAAINNDPKYSATVDGKLSGKADKATTLAGYGITDGASKTDLKTAIDGVVAGAPGALNTLQELAAALGNDSNYAATITRQLSGKADRANTLAGYGIADAAALGGSSNQIFNVAPAYQSAHAVPLSQMTSALSSKADKANTIAGYGITDAALKSDLKTAIDGVTTLMPPNLISNSHMIQIDENAIPAGFSVVGNGAVIKAVHPFTRGYEGPYTDVKPANATANTPTDANQDNPFWFGVNYMGGRSQRGGLADGWGGLKTGHIMKITAPNVARAGGFRSVFFGVKLPLSTSVVYFSAWFYIAKGSLGMGGDAGYMWDSNGMQFNPGSVVIDSKITASAADGWYRYSGLIGISQVTTLGGAQFSIGIGEGEVEAYMALPYLAIPFNSRFMVSC